MKTLFKIFAVLFVLNIINIVVAIISLIYKWIGLYQINNYFFEDLILFSIFFIFPLSGILIYLLSEPLKPIKLWKLSLK